ncbi:fasciclin domain-containing protein [Pontibacter anaerobius]|uniref:Fasciclin domain-containing protein n=1 Tax=Pontibacter anaerobius TaxID=2993940 RepID=A0ABT3RDV0_9BACT|nr:fasciclin domain-containing protein [Pontibacter anaerobius]MCX2739710.1 fasciclin domain-containing protein [Pontibacter anaerobius]
MKKRTIIPMALAATMLFGFGCASSSDTMDDTTAMDSDMTMSETQTMAGNTEDADAVVVEESVVAVAPVATLSTTSLSLENTVEIDNMFENIDDTEQYDVLELAKMEPNLSTFVTLMEQANLKSDLDRLEEYTLFAPTNEAFAKIPKEKLESLLLSENKAQLMRVLQAHVLPSEVSSMQFQNNSRIQMSEDSYIPVEVGVNNTNIRVGGAQVIRPNIEGSNGVIHVIDSVILPEDVQEGDNVGY